MLRDRLVCGLRDVKLQLRLLAEPKLTFRKAFELTLAAEVVERSAKELQEGQRSAEAASVLALQRQQTARQHEDSQACYRCGGHHCAASEE